MYVRITTDAVNLCCESSDDCGGSPVGSLKEPDVKIVRVEDPGTYMYIIIHV